MNSMDPSHEIESSLRSFEQGEDFSSENNPTSYSSSCSSASNCRASTSYASTQSYTARKRQISPPSKKLKTISIKNSLDSVTSTEAAQLNELFAKFLIKFDVPFEVVNSTQLKDFMTKIRPAFKLEDEKTFATKICEDLFRDAMNKTKSKTLEDITLILHFNSAKGRLTASIKPFSKKAIFLEEIGVEGDSIDEFLFKDIYNKLEEEAQIKFNGKVVSIVENFITFNVKGFCLENFIVKSQDAIAEKLIIEVSRPDLLKKIEEIFSAFDIVVEKSDQIWKTELTYYKFFQENLKELKKQAATTDDQQIEMIRQELYNRDLQESVRSVYEILKQLNDISSGIHHLLSNAIEIWLEIFNTTAMIHEGTALYEDIFTKPSLAAYVFNPKFREHLMSPNQKACIRFFIAKLLKDPEEYKKFDEYLDKAGVFSDDDLNQADAGHFWLLFKGYCPKVSKLALVFSSFPSSINVCVETPTVKAIDEELSRKLAFIKNSL